METKQINEIEVPMVEVISSNVSKIGYREDCTILAIQMMDYHLYYYLDVPKIHYDGLLKCNSNNPKEISSIGSYLNRYIKGEYRYVRIK